MPQKIRVTLISSDKSLTDLIKLRLESKDYQVLIFSQFSGVLGYIYSDPPDILMIDLLRPSPEARSIVLQIKADSYFCVIPIIGLIHRNMGESFEWSEYPLDDFILYPIFYPEFFGRVALSVQRVTRVLDHNPLTRLPGNTSIQRAVENVLGKPMAVCYLDINHFKPYNDTYGFSRGDEVIRMTGRIISNVVKESGSGGFTGHIGGDDFVFIVPVEKAESVCQKMIDNFGVIIPEIFGETEREKGYYVAKDRKGQEEMVPLLGIAIAVVPTLRPQMSHYGVVASVSAELKKYAKQSSGSRYVIDRRKD